MPRRAAVFYILALMALAMNIVVPRGYMVARGADGAARIALCTGYAPANAAAAAEFRSRLPDGGKHQDGNSQGHAGLACPYAAHAAPAAAPGSYLLPPPTAAASPPPAALSARAIAPGRGMAAPPPPSQGPPTR